jgi:hypothetical protein
MTKIARTTPTIPRGTVAVAKKIMPRFPEARSSGARRISGRAAIVVHIVTAVAAVKLPYWTDRGIMRPSRMS